jgi:hypothetical protein
MNKIPSPGSEAGACEKKCGHVYCTDLRKTAKAKCLVCGEEIGYDKVFLKYEERLYHNSCINVESINVEKQKIS